MSVCCPLPSVVTGSGVSRSLATHALSGGAPGKESLVSVKASKGAGSPLCHTADGNTFPQLSLSVAPFETFHNSPVLGSSRASISTLLSTLSMSLLPALISEGSDFLGCWVREGFS